MTIVTQCTCGHGVGLDELTAHGFVMVDDDPAYVFIKYRCTECGVEGVGLVDYDKWNQLMTVSEVDEMPVDAKEEFDTMGPIEVDEILKFAEELSTLNYASFAKLYNN